MNGNSSHPRKGERLTKRAAATKVKAAAGLPVSADPVDQGRRASDRMTFMFESSPSGIIEANERGLVTNWNPQAEQIFGWSKGEMVGESLAQTITPRRYRKGHERELEHYMASRERLEPGQMFELAGLHKDGHEFPMEVAVSPAMRNGAGATFVTYVRDLSVQKRGERLEALRVQVTEILAQAAGIDEMANRVLTAICEAFRWQVGEFWAVDPAGACLHQVAAWHGPSRTVKAFVSQGKGLEQARGVGLAGRVWEAATVFEVDDLATNAVFQRGASALAAGLATGVGFPLMNGSEVGGVIAFYTTAPEAVTADRLQIMESVCTQISQFLERDESDHRIRAILEHVADGIVTMDAEGTIESFNRSARRLLGYSLEDAIGHSIDVFVERGRHDEFVEYLANRLRPGKSAPISGTHETVGRRKDGTTFPMEFLATDMHLGGRRIFIATLRDITERKAQTDALEFQALHDSLTGLPNRTLLRDRMAREILAAAREKRSCGLLVLDMDQFKEVNDTLGHECGDQLLQEFAGRISGALREVDTFARLGGDEFAVLPVGAGDMDGVVATATKILAALETPFVIDGTTHHARASIGIAVFPQDAADGGTLLRRADVAMYVAKESHSGYAIYAPEHEEHVGRRMALLGELRQAISKGELVLHYQPRVDVRLKRTIGVEALIRWAHPVHGLMPPADFITAAEASDLIGPLTRWVLDETLGQLRAWDLRGIQLLASINLSAANLLDPELPAVVEGLLKTWSIPASRVVLELTETTLISAGGHETLKRLRALGIGLSLDDFGMGYASLTYLRQLPLTELKLDRSFVGSMATNHNDAAIVEPAVSLGHNLGLTVVAEGVENEATWDMLVACKCDVAQGYYLGRPMPARQLTDWLARSPWRLAEGAGSATKSRRRASASR